MKRMLLSASLIALTSLMSNPSIAGNLAPVKATPEEIAAIFEAISASSSPIPSSNSSVDTIYETLSGKKITNNDPVKVAAEFISTNKTLGPEALEKNVKTAFIKIMGEEAYTAAQSAGELGTLVDELKKYAQLIDKTSDNMLTALETLRLLMDGESEEYESVTESAKAIYRLIHSSSPTSGLKSISASIEELTKKISKNGSSLSQNMDAVNQSISTTTSSASADDRIEELHTLLGDIKDSASPSTNSLSAVEKTKLLNAFLGGDVNSSSGPKKSSQSMNDIKSLFGSFKATDTVYSRLGALKAEKGTDFTKIYKLLTTDSVPSNIAETDVQAQIDKLNKSLGEIKTSPSSSTISRMTALQEFFGGKDNLLDLCANVKAAIDPKATNIGDAAKSQSARLGSDIAISDNLDTIDKILGPSPTKGELTAYSKADDKTPYTINGSTKLNYDYFYSKTEFDNRQIADFDENASEITKLNVIKANQALLVNALKAQKMDAYIRNLILLGSDAEIGLNNSMGTIYGRIKGALGQVELTDLYREDVTFKEINDIFEKLIRFNPYTILKR